MKLSELKGKKASGVRVTFKSTGHYFNKKGTVVSEVRTDGSVLIDLDDISISLAVQASNLEIDDEETILLNIYARYERVRIETLLDIMNLLRTVDTVADARSTIRQNIMNRWRIAFPSFSALAARVGDALHKELENEEDKDDGLEV